MTQLRSKAPALALIAFVLVYGAAGLWTAHNQRGVDFSVYYLSAQAMQRGANIYELTDDDWDALADQYQIADYTKPYLYPPLTAGVVSMFADLSFQYALLAWSVLSVAALLLAGLAMSQLLSARWIDPLVFTALTLYVPLWTTVYAGQVNTFVLLGIALYLLFDQRYRIVASGLALAASLAVKPIAAPLIVHLVWRRDIRRMLAVGLGLVLMAAVSIILAGPQAGLSYLENIGQLSTLSLDSAPTTYPPNQSIFGFFGRLLIQHDHGGALAGDAELARLLSIAFVGIVLVGVASLTWPRRNTRPETFALETGLVLATINLIVPTSWYHHASISIVALLIAWQAVRSTRARAWLVAAFVLIDAQGLLWHHLEGHALLLSLGTYGLLIIHAVTAALVYRLKKQPASTSG